MQRHWVTAYNSPALCLLSTINAGICPGAVAAGDYRANILLLRSYQTSCGVQCRAAVEDKMHIKATQMATNEHLAFTCVALSSKTAFTQKMYKV